MENHNSSEKWYRRNLDDLKHEVFLDVALEPSMKQFIDKLGLIEVKNVCYKKDTVESKRRKAQTKKKYLPRIPPVQNCCLNS